MSCMDFWDINKPYERTVVLQVRVKTNRYFNLSVSYVNILSKGPDWGRPRMTAFDEPPPESDPSLLCQVCVCVTMSTTH